MVILSLKPLSEMFLASLVELFTWFSCLVLRRIPRIHSSHIKYHWLIHWKWILLLWIKLWSQLDILDLHWFVVCTRVLYRSWKICNLWNSATRVYVDDVDWYSNDKCSGIYVNNLDSIFCKTKLL